MSTHTDRLARALADRYRIERELGQGGMATVFLAEDLRHDRRVAIKVLKPELAAVLGADRFVVEIKTTASLQHPHILPLFDSGTADGFLYYVMPFIQGETIREKLNRETQFGVEEAVRIAREVADALDYAHRHGVIHRDIKPENILLHDGRAMVMDFGIALAVSAAAGGRMTETGLSLGTPHYMSPEQATAEKDLTGRSDIYSLASVVYEMLAGQPPHLGGSAQQIIMKIIAEPATPVTQHRRTVPPHVAAAVARALEKLPADRFATAREFEQALAGRFFPTSPGATAEGPGADRSRSVSAPHPALRRAAQIGAGAAVLALGAWGWLRSPPPATPLRARFVIELPDSLRISSTLAQQSLVLAPDGSEFVYPSAWRGGQLLRRRLDEFTVTPVPESRGAWNPRYSPDGRWLALERDNQLIRIPVAGGPATRIADGVSRPSWGDDGSIVFTRGNALWRVKPEGGAAEQLTHPDSTRGERHFWPHVLPGGDAVVFEITHRAAAGTDDGELAVVRVRDGSITRLGQQGSNARYVRSGHLLFARQDGTVSAVAFDLRTLRVDGPAVAVLDGVFVKAGGAAMYSVSNDGMLIYAAGAADVHIVAVNREGRSRRLTTQAGRYVHPRMSPAGDRVAFTKVQGGTTDIWVLVLATGQEFRLTRDGRSERAEWNADGEHLAWVRADSTRDVLMWQRADGSGTATALGVPGSGIVFSRTGGSAAVLTGASASQRDIALVHLEGSAEPRELIRGPAYEAGPDISPDGRWIAYQSNETGTEEVYVASIADPTTRVQISTNGGREAAWALDGRTLYFRAAGTVIAATLSFTPRLEITRREVLFNSPHLPGFVQRAYDIDPKTGELVMLERGDSANERVIVVFGWLEELKERMAAASRR